MLPLLKKNDGPVEVADLRTGLLADHGKLAWMLGPQQDGRPADGSCYSPRRRGRQSPGLSED